MSVEIVNPEVPRETLIEFEQMVVGVLYKIPLSEGDYSTIYTKTLHGALIWFENKDSSGNRVGSYGSLYRRRFRLAPAGTTVTLSN